MRVVVVLAAAAAALLAAAPAHARPGDLDPAYGSAGVRALPVGISSSAAALAVTSGGGAVLAGRTEESGAERSLLARLGPGGAFDATFNGGVPLRARFGPSPDPPQRASAVAVQPDGRIVVAGVAESSWYVARYLPSGAADASFGAAGVVLTRVRAPDGIPDEGGPVGVALRPDGRILVLANLVDPDGPPPFAASVALLGLMPNGTRDASVGGGGLVTSQLGVSSRTTPAATVGGALALLGDGAALVVGRATDRTGAQRPFVARYLANGRRDNRFGDKGRVLLAGGGDLKGIAVSPNGGIAVAGGGNGPNVLAATLESTGALLSLDRMQLGAGASPSSTATAVALDAAGRPWLAGRAGQGQSSSVLVARLHPGGGLDCGFGNEGRVSYLANRSTSPAGEASAATIAPDGAGGMFVAGAAPRAPQEAAFVARVTGGSGASPAVRRARVTTGSASAAAVRGLVDGGCTTTRWRFEYGERSPTRTTGWRTIRPFQGPQDVCVALKGLRAGRRYRVRLVARTKAGTAASTPSAFTARRRDGRPGC
jgi:uncharacterized delta-60 repeat protein